MRWFGWFRCRHEWMVHFVGRWYEGVECIKCGKTDFRPHGDVHEHPVGWIMDAGWLRKCSLSDES